MSTKRNILAALLIFCIFMLIPQYLKMVGVETETSGVLGRCFMRTIRGSDDFVQDLRKQLSSRRESR